MQDVNPGDCGTQAGVIQDRGEGGAFCIGRGCKRWQRGRRYQYFSCFCMVYSSASILSQNHVFENSSQLIIQFLREEIPESDVQQTGLHSGKKAV